MIQKLDKTIPQDVEDELLEKENVVGVGMGRKRVGGQATDREVVVTFVEKKVSEEKLDEDQIVPEALEIEDQEVETDVQEAPGGFHAQMQRQRQFESDIPGSQGYTQPPRFTSDIQTQSAGARSGRQATSGQTTEPEMVTGPFGQTRKDRWRPFVPAGVSVGHPEITAGTLGSSPLTTEDDERVFLTNAHVAAPPEKAEKGDAIIQPGTYDGGTAPDDKIGELVDWSELSEDEKNTSDSALVKITSDIENDILGVSQLRGWMNANYEDEHTKSGRTTATTTSDLLARNVTAQVRYGAPFSKPLKFTGLDVFEAFSAGGDSGSLIGIQRQDGFYGTDLLFAGSPAQTLGIPMDAVQEEHGKLEPEVGKKSEGGRGGSPKQGPSQGQREAPPSVPPQGQSEFPPDLQQGQQGQIGQQGQFGQQGQQGQFGQAPTAQETQPTPEMEIQAAAQNTYTAMTGYLSGNQTVYRWHGGWHPGYTVFYSARPTTTGRYVRCSVQYVYKTSDGNLWYRLQIQNLSSSGTYYDVRASYEYS